MNGFPSNPSNGIRKVLLAASIALFLMNITAPNNGNGGGFRKSALASCCVVC